ncbi:hypothetical protein CP500_012130 [Tychonema bourrellyi FEM_GT703]|uniref:Uncharacterized protein n=1 Tax=Tychonema bourrellyi FEM_GT703 TaxID=2040638 RepID=A0A2G4F0Z2_9CYAN|nr:hypothetical protein CP500_012130 [Tychonema bourrellyi FEM_GT703]
MVQAPHLSVESIQNPQAPAFIRRINPKSKIQNRLTATQMRQLPFPTTLMDFVPALRFFTAN